MLWDRPFDRQVNVPALPVLALCCETSSLIGKIVSQQCQCFFCAARLAHCLGWRIISSSTHYSVLQEWPLDWEGSVPAVPVLTLCCETGPLVGTVLYKRYQNLFCAATGCCQGRKCVSCLVLTLWHRPTFGEHYVTVVSVFALFCRCACSWGTCQREVRPREEMLREYWYLSEGGPLCTKQASQCSRLCTANSHSTESIVLAGLLYTQGPPSPKFQILLSQLRQMADRAAGLGIQSLWLLQYVYGLYAYFKRALPCTQSCTPPPLSSQLKPYSGPTIIKFCVCGEALFSILFSVFLLRF